MTGPDRPAPVRLAEEAGRLYGHPPQTFVAARQARVAELRPADRELARQLAGLRRPTAAAWVVNALARHRPEQLGRLLELGAALRAAQAELDAGALRELDRRRRGVVAALARDGRSLVAGLGSPVGPGTAEEVEETLRAAMADPAAAAAVRAGLLVKGLRTAGLAGVELTGAVALSEEQLPERAAEPTPEPVGQSAEEPGGGHQPGPAADAGPGGTVVRLAAAVRLARRAARQADREADRARSDLRRAEGGLRRAAAARADAEGVRDQERQARAQAREAVEELHRRLAELNRQLERAQDDLDRAGTGLERAEGALQTARTREEEAVLARDTGAADLQGAEQAVQDAELALAEAEQDEAEKIEGDRSS